MGYNVHMHAEEQKAIDRRLARIEGQVRGVRRLVDEGAYCCDVLQQISAIGSALNQVAAAVASQHIQHCVIGHGSDDAHPSTKSMSPEEMMDELKEVLSRLAKA